MLNFVDSNVVQSHIEQLKRDSKVIRIAKK